MKEPGMLDIHAKCRREVEGLLEELRAAREELHVLRESEANELVQALARAERAEREWQVAAHRMTDMLTVVEAAQRFRAQFSKPVSGFPRHDALCAAVDAYDRLEAK